MFGWVSSVIVGLVTWCVRRCLLISELVSILFVEGFGRDPRLSGRALLGPEVPWTACVALTRFVWSVRRMSDDVLGKQSSEFVVLAAWIARLEVPVGASVTAVTRDEALLTWIVRYVWNGWTPVGGPKVTYSRVWESFVRDGDGRCSGVKLI